MAKYRVLAQSIDYLYIDIEADTPEEAREFADEHVDGGDFHQNATDVGWYIDDVYELPEDAPVDYDTKEYFKELEV